MPHFTWVVERGCAVAIHCPRSMHSKHCLNAEASPVLFSPLSRLPFKDAFVDYDLDPLNQLANAVFSIDQTFFVCCVGRVLTLFSDYCKWTHQKKTRCRMFLTHSDTLKKKAHSHMLVLTPLPARNPVQERSSLGAPVASRRSAAWWLWLAPACRAADGAVDLRPWHCLRSRRSIACS